MNKVLLRSQGLRPGARAHFLPPLLRHWAQKQYICYRYSIIVFWL